MGYFIWVAWITIGTLITAWGILHEEQVKAWEVRTWARFRRWRKARQIERIAETLAEVGLTVVPMEPAEIRERDKSCLALIEEYYHGRG